VEDTEGTKDRITTVEVPSCILHPVTSASSRLKKLFFSFSSSFGNAEGHADGTYKRTRGRKTGLVVVERYPDPLMLLLGGGPM
jgi:hypothetical protein